jgi:hypothetical protein
MDLINRMVHVVVTLWSLTTLFFGYAVTTRLFALEPRTKRLFGFTEAAECTIESVQSKVHIGAGIVRMLDSALSM